LPKIQLTSTFSRLNTANRVATTASVTSPIVRASSRLLRLGFDGVSVDAEMASTMVGHAHAYPVAADPDHNAEPAQRRAGRPRR
jgi:hypothetical protein